MSRFTNIQLQDDKLVKLQISHQLSHNFFSKFHHCISWFRTLFWTKVLRTSEEGHHILSATVQSVHVLE
jgi:hypothetical protein